MATLLIVAHIPLASALRAVAQHVFPEAAEGVLALDVSPQDKPDEIEARLRALVPAAGDVLVLTDVFGATPCNAAMRVGDGRRVRIVTGVNVPMMWRALGYAHESLDSVVTRAVAGAAQGVMQVAASRPQNQSMKPSQDDPGNAHHHQ